MITHAPRGTPTRRRGCYAALLLCLALAAGGCKEKSYFPLDAGYSWTHRIVFEPASPDKRKPPPFEGTIRNLPPALFDGMQTTTQVASAGANHSQLVLREDSTGVRVIAEQPAGSSTMETRDDLHYLFRYPVKVGTEWVDDAEPRFFDGSYRVPGVSRVVGFETVTAGAGTYRDAAKVVFHGADDIELADGSVREVTIDTTGWYAPGVGMVRFEQTDAVADDEEHSGRFTIELVKFREL